MLVSQAINQYKFKTDVETLRPVLFCSIPVLAKLNSSNLNCINLNLPSVTMKRFIGTCAILSQKSVLLLFFTEFVYYLYCSPWRFSNGWGTGCVQQSRTMGPLSYGTSEQWTLSSKTINNSRYTIIRFPEGQEWMNMNKALNPKIDPCGEAKATFSK